MNEYELDGQKHPFKLDLFAWEQYEEVTGEPFHGIREGRIKHLISALYCGLVRGGKLENKEFPLDYDQLRENLVSVTPAALLLTILSMSGLADSEEGEEVEEEKK